MHGPRKINVTEHTVYVDDPQLPQQVSRCKHRPERRLHFQTINGRAGKRRPYLQHLPRHVGRKRRGLYLALW